MFTAGDTLAKEILMGSRTDNAFRFHPARVGREGSGIAPEDDARYCPETRDDGQRSRLSSPAGGLAEAAPDAQGGQSQDGEAKSGGLWHVVQCHNLVRIEHRVRLTEAHNLMVHKAERL